MTIKYSSLAAGGHAHPELRPGDKWKDSRGNIVIIESYRSDIKSLSKRKFVQKMDKLLYSMYFKNRQKTTTALTGSNYDPNYD